MEEDEVEELPSPFYDSVEPYLEEVNKMPHPGRTRTTPEKTCRCPSCDYEYVIEEGQKCSEIECPRCGHRMR